MWPRRPASPSGRCIRSEPADRLAAGAPGADPRRRTGTLEAPAVRADPDEGCGRGVRRRPRDDVSDLSQLTDSQRVRRVRILDAALALSKHRPFEQIQMKDVAEASGVALGTMYPI